MAAKVQTKIENVTARGGIFYAESSFRGLQLDKLIKNLSHFYNSVIDIVLILWIYLADDSAGIAYCY